MSVYSCTASSQIICWLAWSWIHLVFPVDALSSCAAVDCWMNHCRGKLRATDVYCLPSRFLCIYGALVRLYDIDLCVGIPKQFSLLSAARQYTMLSCNYLSRVTAHSVGVVDKPRLKTTFLVKFVPSMRATYWGALTSGTESFAETFSLNK